MRRRPTETRLRRAFADVLVGLLATSAGACGGTTTNEGPGGGGGGPTPAMTSMCGPSGPTERTILQGMRATPAVDGAMYRTESAFARTNNPQTGGTTTPPPPENGDAWSATNGEPVGAMCATATDPSACKTKVGGFRLLPTNREACIAQFPFPSNSDSACGTLYILYTRGDEIGVARTNEEQKALFGTFDTVDEALWVARQTGLEASCRTLGAPQGLPDSEYRTTQDGGWDLSLLDAKNCGDATFKVLVHVDYAGNLTEVSRENLNEKPACYSAGRRPEGFCADAPLATDDAVGAYFATMASLEAASVTAFRRLHRQLEAFGAPRELLARVRKAAKDEIRHARTTGALARKYGATPRAPRIAPTSESPSLFAVALENAREGCVRETYGALVAHLQTTRAADPEVRACMAVIADEETEHAALSWDVAAWLESQLGDAERARLAAERHDAFNVLARELATPVDARVARASGIPGSEDARRLLEGLGPMLLAA